MKPLSAFVNLLSQFIPLVLTFTLAATSYWLAIQSELDLFAVKGKADPANSDYYLRNFTVQSHNLSEHTYAIIRSAAADHIPKDNVWNIHQPQMEQFEAGNVMVQGTAKKGFYKMNSEEMVLMEDVTLKNKKNGLLTVMKSEEIVIDNLSSEIRANKNVTITRPNQRFEAQRVTLNNSTGELKSQGAVKFYIENPQ